jgi:hypothetical protein
MPAPDYEPPTPAEEAIADAKTGGGIGKSKLLWIIGIVVLLLVLCGVASCAGFGAFMNIASSEVESEFDDAMSEVEAELDAATEELEAVTEEPETVTEETDDIPA